MGAAMPPELRFQEVARLCGACGFRSQPGTERCPQCGAGSLQPVGSVKNAPPKVMPARRGRGGDAKAPPGDTQPIAAPPGRPSYFQRLTAALGPSPLPPRNQFAAKIRRNAVWNVTSRDGQWVCPYCGKGAGFIGRGMVRERGIMAHLSSACPSYRADRKPLTLKEARARARVLDIRGEAARLLDTHPMWRYRDLEGAIVCPFCAEVTDAPFPQNAPPPDASLDALAEHLARCPEYAPGRGYAQAPRILEEAKSWADEVVRIKRVARTLAVGNAEWMVWDEEENWFCCFCAGGTGVHLPENAPLTEATVRDLALHLVECAAYGRGRGEPKPLSELEVAVDRWNRERRLVKELTTRVAVLANWQRIDRYGNWLCPYCEGPILKVPPAEREIIAETLPPKIRDHLEQGCGPFRSGLLATIEGSGEDDRLFALFRAVHESPAGAPPADLRTPPGGLPPVP